MKTLIKRTRLLAMVAALTPISASYAIPISYTNLASFDTVSSTSIIEDFNGPGLIYDAAISSFSSNSITYTGLAGVPFPNVYLASGSVNAAGGSTILTANGDEDFSLTFSSGVSAIGFDTYDNNIGGVTISVFDESDVFLGSFLQDHAENQVGFFGVVSDVNIGSLRWTGVGGAQVNTGIDNIRLGTIIGVAEPSSVALFALGLTVVGYTRRKKR